MSMLQCYLYDRESNFSVLAQLHSAAFSLRGALNSAFYVGRPAVVQIDEGRNGADGRPSNHIH